MICARRRFSIFPVTDEQTDKYKFKTTDSWALVTACAVAMIAGVTFFGWLYHIPRLIEPWAGQATMKCNTAAALLVSVLSVIALFIYRQTSNRGWKRLAQVSVVFVLVTGLLTILEYLTGTSLGIDQLIVSDWGSQRGTSTPGRMGLNTATMLTFFGLSQLLIGSEFGLSRRVGYLLVISVSTGAIFSLVGYMYGVPYLYKIRTFTEMALSTAISFGLLSIAALTIFPKEGPVGYLTSPTAGGIVARRLLPAAVLAPPLFGWLRLQGERAGLYPFEFGLALMVMSMMLAMAVLAYWIIHAVEKEDRTRAYAKAIKRSEEKYRSVTESATDAIISTDSQGNIIFVNRAFESTFGYTSAEVQREPLTLLMPLRFHEGYKAGLQKYLNTGEAPVIGRALELAGRKKSGEEFPLEFSLGAWKEEDRTLFTAIIRDITERQKAEQKFRALLESAPDAMVITDVDGKIIIVNTKAETLFGYSRDEMLGNKVEMLIPERVRSKHVGHRSDFSLNPHSRPMGAGLELYAVRKGGEEFPVEISLGPLETENGTIISTTIRDVTDRMQAQDQARRLQLLSTRQDFLAALMHNLKNPIIGADRVLEVVTSDDFRKLPSELTKIFSELKQSNRRVLNMMNELIEVYQYETDPRVVDPCPNNINEIVRGCINDAMRTAKTRRVEIVAEFDDGIEIVRVDRTGIIRVVENLLDNAIKFSDEGSEVRVTLSKRGVNLELAVHNFGRIISEEEIHALFRGFWKGVAGKSVSPGTGLGLYLCRILVEGHQGELICKSQEGFGTTFTVVLPT